MGEILTPRERLRDKIYNCAHEGARVLFCAPCCGELVVEMDDEIAALRALAGQLAEALKYDKKLDEWSGGGTPVDYAFFCAAARQKREAALEAAKRAGLTR
jgi:hypothetical protein